MYDETGMAPVAYLTGAVSDDENVFLNRFEFGGNLFGGSKAGASAGYTFSYKNFSLGVLGSMNTAGISVWD